MKKDFSVVELAVVIKELQLFVGARINKVFQHSDKLLSFECFRSGKGRFFLNVCRPGLLWFGSSKFVGGGEDFGFYKSLSRLIAGGRFESIAQVGSERIVKLVIIVGGKKFLLYVELYNKGEVVLCDDSGKILCLWETQLWKDRQLKVGVDYLLPKKLVNVFSMSQDEFADVLNAGLNNKDSTVSKVLAADLGIGGLYAVELCDVSGIDKNKNKVTLEENGVLFANLKFLCERKIDARVVFDGSIIRDVAPFSLRAYELLRQDCFKSFCDALDFMMSKTIDAEDSAVCLSKFDVKKKKLENVVEVQKLYLSVLQKQIVDEHKKGELIYENYQKFKMLLNKISASKLSFRELKLRAKEFGLVDFDDKTGDAVVDV